MIQLRESIIASQTIWGLNPIQLHDRFWAARGVQVVQQGSTADLAADAELFLLTDPHCLCIFRLGQLVDTLSWLKPAALVIRLHNSREQGYRERLITDHEDRFIKFERVYGDVDARIARVALTPRREVAEQWQKASSTRAAWQNLRRSIHANQRHTMSVEGSVFDGSEDQEVMSFVRDLVNVWRRPDATIRRAHRLDDQTWSDRDYLDPQGVRFIGPVWVGAGRRLGGTESVVGPAVLWDEPNMRPAVESLEWTAIEPTEALNRAIQPRRLNSFQRASKRLFDIVFSLIVLALTLPIYPVIMLAIWLEDGRPFLFAHRRESMGGREFPCIKFRTMRNDAEEIKQKLLAENMNQVDGPQFYIENDPRITRVGRLLRKTNLDEIPQFLNVLAGHMSVVGPRPSPFKENQYCPPWREARLSVRPGITGLWQVYRSREVGKDFQEWIRYDIAYVENLSILLDTKIILRTIGMFLGFKG